MKYWLTISWQLVPTAVHGIPMLIGSWRANSLFVLRRRAVYFLSFGLLLNYRFVFPRTSSFQTNRCSAAPTAPDAWIKPRNKTSMKERGPKTSADLPSELKHTGQKWSSRMSTSEPTKTLQRENSVKRCCKPSKNRKKEKFIVDYCTTFQMKKASGTADDGNNANMSEHQPSPMQSRKAMIVQLTANIPLQRWGTSAAPRGKPSWSCDRRRKMKRRFSQRRQRQQSQDASHLRCVSAPSWSQMEYLPQEGA